MSKEDVRLAIEDLNRHISFLATLSSITAAMVRNEAERRRSTRHKGVRLKPRAACQTPADQIKAHPEAARKEDGQ